MDEPEWRTRKERIDRRLTALKPGWTIVRFKDGMDTARLDCHAVEEFPAGNGFADYALFVKGKLLGFIEAKKVSVDPQNVLEQAKRYARDVSDGVGSWNGFGVPFLYSTNGELIWHLDTRGEKQISRTIADFHTPDALAELFNRKSDPSWFDRNPIDLPKIRPYQKEAITAAEKAIVDGKRSFLLAMATGTGKTFTTVAQIYRLLKSNSAKRILFLVDRRALAAQAVRAFAAFDTPSGNKLDQEYEIYSQSFRREDLQDDDDKKPFNPKVLPDAYLTAPQSTHTFVYVTTIQRMAINLFGKQAIFEDDEEEKLEEDAEKLDIPIHAFDIIVADECHRGYTAKETGLWRKVIDHFDAVKIGLTATPAIHTMNLFKEVVYRYTTTQAIQEGFLVDYDAVRIKSNIRMNGLFLKEGEQVAMVDRLTGAESLDFLEDEREFVTTDIEQKITAEDSNRKIIQEIAKYAKEHEQKTGRFPKTLIFAANDLHHVSHADQLVRICREVFDQGDDFVQKITGSPSVDRPLQRIKEFRNRPKPKIVVTVDMLTTGVDIPALEFLVFLRPVRSRILWVQMLGRGTRRCDEINKENFVIFDCFDGTLIDYFKNATDFFIDPPAKETVPLKDVIENIYQNRDRGYWTNVLVKRLRRIERGMSGEAIQKFAAFIPDGDIGRFASELQGQIKNDFANTVKILQNSEFQQLLLNYPRGSRPFLKAMDQVDTVMSEYEIRHGDKLEKASDYLESFCRFVKENRNEIEAIQILLERPKSWRPDALSDLQKRLFQSHFSEDDLQKAHQFIHHKALVDIISMVKHAVREQEPLLSADERVDSALNRVMTGKSFTDEQKRWIGFIREHLVRNLSLELRDFDVQPALEMRGGLTRAQQVFKNQLQDLVTEINMAIAA